MSTKTLTWLVVALAAAGGFLVGIPDLDGLVLLLLAVDGLALAVSGSELGRRLR